jgi:hypothetical protein
MKATSLVLLLLAAGSAAVVPALAKDAVIAFNNEAQQVVRDYGIPSQISSKVRSGAACPLHHTACLVNVMAWHRDRSGLPPLPPLTSIHCA